MNASHICLPEVCEHQNWFGGAVGQCNNVTGVCDCPPGFDGTYILSSAKDCHMLISAKQVLNAVTLSTALCTLVGSIIAFVKVAIEISAIYTPVVFNKSSRVFPMTEKLGEQGPRVSVAKTTKAIAQPAVLKRKLLVIRTIMLYFLHAACEVYRSAFLVADTDAFAVDMPPHVLISYGLGACAATVAIMQFLYIYTTSLPKGGQLAAVLGIEYDARRYRKLLNWVFKYNTIFCVLVLGGSSSIAAAKVSNWYLRNFTAMELIAHTIVSVDLFAVASFVYYMNVPIFKKIIKHSTENRIVPKLKVAIFRCELCVYVAIACICGWIPCSVLVSLDSRFNFILYTFIAINVHSCLLLGCYLLGWDFVSVVKPDSTEGGKPTYLSSGA